MAASRALVGVLVTGMLVTGVANTLLTKYQDMQCVRNCDGAEGREKVYFEQPVVQTLQMFIGEMGCWLFVGLFSLQNAWRECRRKSQGYEPVGGGGEGSSGHAQETTNPVVKALVLNSDEKVPIAGWRIFMLAVPACCDIAGTTLMNVGFLFVAASIYQMTRGALVLFVGLFSVIFLKRHLFLFQWFALFVVVLGVGIVGLAGALWQEKEPATEPDSITTTGMAPAVRTVVGILLIAGAQIFTATQFVVEEWILENYALEPLKVVGWEGVFGFSVTLVGMGILHLLIGSTPEGQYGYFDAVEGWREVTHYPVVAFSSLAIMVSIGGFNFFGISVTRSISATARSIIDTCRTLFIWIASLALQWESFKPLQIVGFSMLVYGTFLFNEIVNPPFRGWARGLVCKRKGREEEGEEEVRRVLLPEGPIEHN